MAPSLYIFPSILTYCLPLTWVTYNKFCFPNQCFFSKLYLAANIRLAWIWSIYFKIDLACYASLAIFGNPPSWGKSPRLQCIPCIPVLEGKPGHGKKGFNLQNVYCLPAVGLYSAFKGKFMYLGGVRFSEFRGTGKNNFTCVHFTKF